MLRWWLIRKLLKNEERYNLRDACGFGSSFLQDKRRDSMNKGDMGNYFWYTDRHDDTMELLSRLQGTYRR